MSRGRERISVRMTTGLALVSARPRERETTAWSASRFYCLERLAQRGVPLEMLSLASQRIRFVIPEALVELTRRLLDQCGLAWRLVPNCCKAIVSGNGVRTTAGVFYRVLTRLTEHGVPLLHSSDSDTAMSLIVPSKDLSTVETLLGDLFAASSTPVELDAERGSVVVRGREHRLGSRQVRLLEYLLENAGRVVKAEDAAQYVFGRSGQAEVAALRVHMHNLRKKVEADPENPRYILTKSGGGYFFTE